MLRWLGWLRGSFAAKLLAAGLLLALVVVGGVSGYLIVSRNGQTRVGALSNADNRALTMRQVLDRFTGEQSFATAMGLAGQQPLILALSGTSPANAVPKLFSVSPPVDLSDEVLVRGWFPVTAVIRVGHAESSRGELVPLAGRDALYAALGSFWLSLNPRLLRRFFPRAAALSRLPGWDLGHGCDPGTRLEAAARLLCAVR